MDHISETARADGRRLRGEARKAKILDAALSVIGQEGIAALTHRAIAKEADIPFASVSYYFDGIDAVLISALERATDDLVERLRVDPPGTSAADFASFLTDALSERRKICLAEYELYLLAARRPKYAASALAWLDALTDHFAPTLDEDERLAFQATVEGVTLHALLRPEYYGEKRIESVLSAVWPK